MVASMVPRAVVQAQCKVESRRMVHDGERELTRRAEGDDT
jgi:hypothetical protein